MRKINYLAKTRIKEWLLKNYTYTDKHTFINPTQLLAEYAYNIYQVDPNNMDYPDLLSSEEYKKFWIQLQKIFKELKWPIEENYLYYPEEDNTKIPGIYYLLKLEDQNNKSINEIPQNRILTYEIRSANNAGVTNISYFMDFLNIIEKDFEEDLNDPYNEVDINSLDAPYDYWDTVDLINQNPKTVKDL